MWGFQLWINLPASEKMSDPAYQEFSAAAIPERRERAAGYFPTRMEVLGVPASELRKVLRPLARSLRDKPAEDVLKLARALLRTRVHEARQVAFELFEADGSERAGRQFDHGIAIAE